MADAIKLPEPRVNISAGNWCSITDCHYYTADQMHANAAVVTAAARDCRTCAAFDPRNGDHALNCETCVQWSEYQPLPPVRLWRPRAASSSA